MTAPTDGALEYARDNMFTVANGDRPGVPNVLVLLTTGVSSSPSDTAAQAETIRSLGHRIVTVGVGAGVNVAELNEVATDPDVENVFLLTGGGDTAVLASMVSNAICAQGMYYVSTARYLCP